MTEFQTVVFLDISLFCLRKNSGKLYKIIFDKWKGVFS